MCAKLELRLHAWKCAILYRNVPVGQVNHRSDRLAVFKYQDL